MRRLLTTRFAAINALRSKIPIRYSSGSPTAGNALDHFTKTGEKEEEPAKMSREYSQSGGDEMVAAQGSASFSLCSM
jgi:hypothetical protein